MDFNTGILSLIGAPAGHIREPRDARKPRNVREPYDLWKALCQPATTYLKNGTRIQYSVLNTVSVTGESVGSEHPFGFKQLLLYVDLQN